MKYRIKWKSAITGHSGHGTVSYETREEAQQVADYRNKRHPKRDRIEHSVEPVDAN